MEKERYARGKTLWYYRYNVYQFVKRVCIHCTCYGNLKLYVINNNPTYWNILIIESRTVISTIIRLVIIYKFEILSGLMNYIFDEAMNAINT